MKQKLIALISALALMLSLTGCLFSTPDSAGTLGTVDISSGLYLLAQYDAYQKAADLASSDQNPAEVKTFLKQTITLDEESGETAVVSDYVAQETLKNLETYAAIEARFDALGGQLTAEEEQQADRYADQLMENYGDTYKANGIGLNTLRRFERILLKSTDLLTLVYGAEGETPIPDAELTQHLENEMYDLVYYTVPLYNTSTFTFANDDHKAQMLALAQAAADQCNTYSAGYADLRSADSTNALISRFSSVVPGALPQIYAVLDSAYSSDSKLPQTQLLGSSALTSSFTAEGALDTIRSLSFGKAAAVQLNGYSLIIALRVDPLAVSSLENLRLNILSDLKGQELSDTMAAYGASLEHGLSSSAMKKLPASKIVYKSTNE